MEKKITDKVTKVIDKRINTETARLRKVIDDSVGDIRRELESDIDDLTERVSEISAGIENTVILYIRSRKQRLTVKYCGQKTAGDSE